MALCPKRSCAGFSLIELLLALFIFFILAAVAVISFTATRRSIKTGVAVNTVFSLLEQARQRAITDRMQHRVTITRSPDPLDGLINLISIDAINPTDGTVTTIRKEYLPQDVVLARSPSAPLVGSPIPIPTDAVFDAPIPNGKLILIYNVDGSTTDAASNPLTCTIFFSDTPLGRNPALMRAVSIYSSTGEIKCWFYDGNKFVSGVRNY